MKKAFTLIELLVVVLIIGILSAIALPQYTKAVEKARATEMMVNVKHIQDAWELQHLASPGSATGVETKDIVELTGGTWSADGQRYCTKYFVYSLGGSLTSDKMIARCTPNANCGCTSGTELYDIYVTSPYDTSVPSGADWRTYDECTVTNDIGYTILGMLKSQGRCKRLFADHR